MEKRKYSFIDLLMILDDSFLSSKSNNMCVCIYIYIFALSEFDTHPSLVASFTCPLSRRNREGDCFVLERNASRDASRDAQQSRSEKKKEKEKEKKKKNLSFTSDRAQNNLTKCVNNNNNNVLPFYVVGSRKQCGRI